MAYRITLLTPRFYRTTRPLLRAVRQTLSHLGSGVIGSPTTLLLIGLYVSGLILPDARPTQTRVSRFLPGRCHDTLNRLLRVVPLSTRALMGLLIARAKRPGRRLSLLGRRRRR